jgi:hypothetical protein
MHPTLALLNHEAANQAVGLIFRGAFLAGGLLLLIVFHLRVLRRIFEKAGQEGWQAFIPVYHHVILTRLAGLSAWWTLPMLLLAPLVLAHGKPVKLLALVLLLVWWGWLCQRLAQRFGKGIGFGLGLTVPMLGLFFRTALAYDRSTYQARP